MDWIYHIIISNWILRNRMLWRTAYNLFCKLSLNVNLIGDVEIWTLDLPSTSIMCYQLSCPDWICSKCYVRAYCLWHWSVTEGNGRLKVPNKLHYDIFEQLEGNVDLLSTYQLLLFYETSWTWHDDFLERFPDCKLKTKVNFLILMDNVTGHGGRGA